MTASGLQKIIDQSIDLICTTNEAGKFVWLNPACFSIIGYTPQELEGKAFLDFIYEEDKPGSIDICTQIRGGISTTSFENRYVHKNGSLIPILWSAKWDDDDKVMYSVGKDLTEKKQLEAAQKQHIQRYKALVENGSDAVVILDAAGNPTYVSPGVQKMLGYSDTEALELGLFGILHPDDNEAVAKVLEECLKNPGLPVQGHVGRLKHKNGTWRWVDAVVTNMLHDPIINGIIDNFRDITDTVIATQKLEQSEKKYKYLFENNPCPMIIWDFASTQIIDCNEEAQLKYGYTRDEFLQLSIYDIRPPEDIPAIKAAIITEEVYGEIHKKVWRHKKKNGEIMLIALTGHLFTLDERRASLVMLEDITEKEQAQQLLKERNVFIETAIENLPIGISVNKINEGTATLMNKKFAEIYGWPKEELLNVNRFFENIFPDTEGRKKLKERIIADIKSRNADRMNWEGIPITTKDGKHRIVNAKNIPLYDQNLMISTVVDVTDKIKAEQELLLSNERYDYVTKATTDAIWDLDLVNHTIYWGEGYHYTFGYNKTHNDSDLKTWEQAIHPFDFKRVIGEMDAILASTNNRYLSEYRFKKANGEYAYVLDKGFVIRNPDGKAIRVVGAMQDYTLQKNDEQRKLIFNKISMVFNKSFSLQDTLVQVLQIIGDWGSYIFAETWLVDTNHKKLNLTASLKTNDAIQGFYQSLPDFTVLSLGESLPGYTWLSKKVTYWNVHELGIDFARSAAAIKAGIKGIYSIPLYNNKLEIIGVLLLGSSNEDEFRLVSTDFFEDFGKHLGSEIKRKQLESELHQIFNYSEDIISISDLQGFFKKLNPAASTILGYSEEELLSKPFGSFVHPHDLQRSIDALTHLSKSPQNIYFENRFITKSNEVKWLGWTISSSPDDGLVFSIGKDVTKQKNLQTLLDRATDLARMGVWEIDTVHNTVHWSPLTRALYEVPDDFVPDFENTPGFFWSEADLEKIRQVFEIMTTTGQKMDIEVLIKTWNGNKRWVRLIGEPEYYNNQVVKIIGSLQDIHQLKEAELALSEMNNKLISTLDSIQDGFYALDKNWNITYWNTEAERLLLRKKEEIIGKNIWEEFSAATSLKFFAEYHHAMHERVPVRFEEFFPPLNCWYDISAYPSENGITVYFKNITGRKKAELDLHKFKMVIENSKDGIGIVEIENSQIYMNPEFEIQLGYKPGELRSLGGPTISYCDRELAFNVLQTLSSGKYWKGDVEIYNRAGEKISFFLSGGPIFDKRGQVFAVYGIHTDITERKNIEISLRQALEEKNIVLESIGDAFISFDKNWIVTYWNKQAENLLGTKREDVIERNIWDVFSDAVGTEFYSQYYQAMESGKLTAFEAFYKGVGKWFEVTAYPSAKGLSVYFRDVTRRKYNEEQIRLSNERFVKVAEATNDAIWEWNMEEDSMYWGDGFKKLFGYDLDQVKTSHNFWLHCIHTDDRHMVLDSLELLLSDEKATHWQVEYRFQKANNSYAFVVDRGIVMRNNDGKAIKIVGAITDITEQKKSEAYLKRLNEDLNKRAKELAISNSELEQFAFVASHDLQEPLRMVTSFLAQLEKKYSNKLDDKATLYISLATDGAKRMRQIILDLLEFSRVGKQRHELEYVDLNKIVEEVISLQQAVIQEKNAEIIAKDLPILRNYRIPLLQVFQNLIGNALKYSRPNVTPCIEITAVSIDDNWQIAIKDNGIGMSEEYFDKIFIIFQRLHSKSEYEGTGMGLSIVKKIIDHLEGRIWLTSTVGEGSTFYFTLKKNE